MGKKDNRRQSGLINKSLQYRFLVMMLIYSLILIVFFGLTLFVPEFMQMYDETLGIEVRKAAAQRILAKHAWVWPVVIFIACILGLHSYRAFHRVAGPLYRFRWAFEQVREGDIGLRVKIRQKDYLHLEEASLNEMLRALEGRLKIVKQTGRDASKTFEALEKGLKEGKGRLREQEDVLRLHREHLDKLMEELEFFRLKHGE